MLMQCREEFPSVHMINICKANALRDYKDNPTDFKLAMKECRTEYKKLKFDPKDLLPVTWHKDRIYFAGAGLNTPLKMRDKNNNIGMTENFGNFNCYNPINAQNNKNLIEYILVGNTSIAGDHSHTAISIDWSKNSRYQHPKKEHILTYWEN